MLGMPTIKDCPCTRPQLVIGGLLCGVAAIVLITLAVRTAMSFDNTESGGVMESGVSMVPVEMLVGATYPFTTPNYPHGYPPYEHIEWNFRAPTDGALTLVCVDIQLSWFTHMYVTDGNITHRLSCYDCALPMSFSHEFSSPDAVVGLHNKLFFTAPGFNCTMRVSQAAPDCSCGLTVKNRIVGGTETDPLQYPWMAGISLMGSTWIFCGGSLITDRHILTAAHCTRNLTANQMGVSLGLHHTSNQPLFRSPVLQLIDHPAYDGDYMLNDISVLRIRPVDFSEEFRIRPICLPSGSGSYAERLGIVIGWGTTTYEGFMSHVLLEVRQRVVSNEQCKRYYGSQIVDSMLCAGGLWGEDACQGDSGGPLFVEGPSGAQELIGLVSFGLRCGAGWPGVYTRVPSFMEWLESTITGGLQCPPPPEL